MAKYRLKTEMHRWQYPENKAPVLVRFPAGSVIEPTRREFQAFHDVMERVDDGTAVTEPPEAKAEEPDTLYDPEGDPVETSYQPSMPPTTGSTLPQPVPPPPPEPLPEGTLGKDATRVGPPTPDPTDHPPAESPTVPRRR